jgi:hypothetical protein
MEKAQKTMNIKQKGGNHERQKASIRLFYRGGIVSWNRLQRAALNVVGKSAKPNH